MKRRLWKFSFSIFLGLATIMPAKPIFAGSATWAHKSVTSDWKNPANWTPSVVPDGAADVATFSGSKSLLVTLASSDEVSGIIFTSAVPHPYALFVVGLTISGSGVTNNSTQNSAFWTYSDPNSGVSGTIQFANSATAGANLNYNVIGVPDGSLAPVGKLIFSGQSNAGTAFCENYAGGSTIEFHDNSTATAATFFSLGGRGDDTGDLSGGSYLSFYDNSNAGSASVQNLGGYGLLGNMNPHLGTTMAFYDDSSAGNAIIINGPSDLVNQPGVTIFADNSTAGQSSITNSGATYPAHVGTTFFLSNSTGSFARFISTDGGALDLSGHIGPGITIGSIEGDGAVFVGARNLSIGSNSLSTSFSGVIQDGGASGGVKGSLTKIGTGNLTLTSANLYTGVTLVTAGTLSGTSTYSGALTVGANRGNPASIAPGVSGFGMMTTKRALTFNKTGSYLCEFDSSTVQADEITAKGVKISNGARINLVDLTIGNPSRSVVLTIINNTAGTPIAGVFSNLPDNSLLTINGNTYQARYEGGDGNDLTLTLVVQ